MKCGYKEYTLRTKMTSNLSNKRNQRNKIEVKTRGIDLRSYCQCVGHVGRTLVDNHRSTAGCWPRQLVIDMVIRAAGPVNYSQVEAVAEHLLHFIRHQLITRKNRLIDFTQGNNKNVYTTPQLKSTTRRIEKALSIYVYVWLHPYQT